MIDYKEIAERPSLIEMGGKITVCDVLDFFISPFYQLVKGAYQGYKQAEENAERETAEFLANLDAKMEVEDVKYRRNRLDDFQYENGLLGLEKSKYEFGKMLNPSAKKTQTKRQPKITHSENYKVYD